MMDDAADRRLSTGIDGLDEILHGGLIPDRSYMVNGGPGTGKTILGLHFLTADPDASTLFINLEEDASDVRANAARLGFDLSDVTFLDLSPESDVFVESESYTLFPADEVEGQSLREEISSRVREVSPDRLFIDPLTEIQHLFPESYQFRRQISSFFRFVKEQQATVLFTSQATSAASDEELQFLCDGTIMLSHDGARRSLSVPKFRGSDTESGDHTVRITDEGMAVFPKLDPDSHRSSFPVERISSGVPELDELLKGGVERGTVTVLSGPSGVGKTTLGTQFMKEAAGRGERSVIYMFEEKIRTFDERSKGVNIPVEKMRDRGTLAVEEVEPLQISTDEFASMVRREVEANDASIVMIDGIDGYRLSLLGEDGRVSRELNALCRYLRNVGVSVILVDSTAAVTGEFRATEGDISYLADNLIFMRYVEIRGELRKAIGILKKRTSDHEHSLREFEITSYGIKVGEPLSGLRGILSGMPELMSTTDDE